MSRTREEWLQAVESGLPSEDRYSERNRAISARYARWYLDNPDRFKWSGMAAFASRQVGLAIQLAELMRAPERIGEGNPLVLLHRMACGVFMISDLDEMRSGNNAIFRDIAWAHAAYLEGGLAEIEANLSGSEGGLMLEGFRLIDRGVKLASSDPADDEAGRLVWQGNIALLRHEQTAVLQPVFDRLSPGGRVLASFGSELDFSGARPSEPACLASFASFYGYLNAITGMKSVADAVHRWQWVESNVVPAWSEADRRMQSNPLLNSELSSMAASEPDTLQRLSGFVGSLIQQIR